MYTFADAVKLAYRGNRIARKGWNDFYYELGGNPTAIIPKTHDGFPKQYITTSDDHAANDWIVLEKPKEFNMNWINMFSGPIQALVRYGITAAGGAVVARGWVEASVADQVVGAAIALVPAVVGALTATKRATVAHVAALPEVSHVTLNNGREVHYPEAVNSAMNDR